MIFDGSTGARTRTSAMPATPRPGARVVERRAGQLQNRAVLVQNAELRLAAELVAQYHHVDSLLGFVEC